MEFRLLGHVRNLRVQRMELSLIGGLLRHLVLPLSFEHLREVELRIDVVVLAVLLHAHGLCGLLAVPGLATFGGLVPPFATVSHLQYVAAGVPARSLKVGLRGLVLERCLIHAYPRVLLLLVSIGLEAVYPWLLVLQ